MSWAQRRGASRPNQSSNPPVQVYNPNQHSSTEWQATGSQTWHPPPQPHPQQLPRQDINQTQPYWQQPSQSYPLNQTPNANNTPAQFQQQQQYHQQDHSAYFQTPGTTEYSQQQAYGSVQYPQQQYERNNVYAAPQPVSNEPDAWSNWGWGDDDNSNAHNQPVVSQQPQASLNQSIGDSFATDESWNWSVMDSQQQQNPEEMNPRQEQNLFPTIGDIKSKQDNLGGHGGTNRKKLDTPQWSTESQPSLESSDDILHTSESDKSHMVSRSSTISHESSLSAQGLVHHRLEASVASSQLVENKEIIKQDSNATSLHPRSLHTPPSMPPPPQGVNPPKTFLPPPPPGSEDSRNPYKRTAGLSHRSANSPFTPLSGVAPPTPSFNQLVNLETLPDNSEHPDHPLQQSDVKTTGTGHQQWQQTENNEAPINDRNQYLETGQLSEVNLAEGNEAIDLSNDTLPPPGLQRMIPGQLEQNEIGPGFSRMVLGQNENRPNISGQSHSQFHMGGGPPEGLHRMVPGESSSPETSLRQPNLEENDSELEMNQLSQGHHGGVQPPRSATIGADTPPIQSRPPLIQSPPLSSVSGNRSETIGSDLAASVGGDLSEPSQGGGVLSTDNRSSKSIKAKEKVEHHDRREAIEGQTNESNISNLTNAVRNLTVGENLTDGHTSNTSLPEHSPRRHSRQESSDSDSDRKNSRSHRDKRSVDKSLKTREKDRDRYKERDSERDRYRERNSDRYSPDPYRDKRDGKGRRYKDRRFEEDTDYYSDKDKRVRDDRDRDYERKYSSLRKDKDKRRKDRDSREPRDYRDSRRSDYYYRGYGEDYVAENRSSRPSSRSDSMHESYRERRHEPDARERRPRDRDRERERERYRNREPRDVYNPYQSFAYDRYNPYYQQYQYYENLRRTNPQAYAEWYRKYYQQAAGSTASYTGEDRASVHSGRSSANEELVKGYTRQSFYSQSNYYGQAHSISGHYGLDSSSMAYNKTLDQTDTSLLNDEHASSIQRLTPTKFATAHLKASINSGKLVRILPNYPMDGQMAQVELCDLQAFLEHDPDYQELSSFPGPLVKGVTHKKQIIEYCDSKIKGAMCSREIVDVDSYVLMWELLILLIRQNGMVVGTDIAELLLKNRTAELAPRPPSALSNTSSNIPDRNEISEASNQPISEHGSTQSIVKEEEVTRKFREYLLYGSCQEALEWAMKHGLWGHALFLASKLDKRTYANVMMRFANGLTMNDPLQTLYQLLSGKMPAVVTCASDEKWGDWRPHLAMILSNSIQRPELNCKAITQLGDTLLNRGSLYAAQFCYLMAEVGFGKHSDPETRLVLLGSDHRKPFPQFVTNEAIHMTEIYEFACSLNDQGFHISEFQFYKYLLATRLADFGLLERALKYLELLATRIIDNPAIIAPSLVDCVCALSDRLKFYDPVGDAEDEVTFGGALETSRPDNSWLKDLSSIQNDYHSGRITQDVHQDTMATDTTLQQSPYHQHQDLWQQEQQQYDQQQQTLFEQQQYDQQLQYQETPVWTAAQQQQASGGNGFHVPDVRPQPNLNQYPDHNNYWSGQHTQPWGEQLNQYGPDTSNTDQLNIPQEPATGYYESSNNQIEDAANAQPQISMPHQPKGKSVYDDEPLPHEKQVSPKPKPQSPKQESNQSTGWFGGIFSKLSMRPKNQMKLPDDKNPKIVWDENKKKWINVDEDPNDPASELKPPPKMADLMPKMTGSVTPQMSGTQSSTLDYSSGNTASGSLNYNSTSTVVDSSLGFDGNANVNFNNVPFHTDQNKLTTGSTTSLPSVAQKETSVAPAKPAQSNMFKMQKNRNVKNAYVDVFKQNGVKPNTDSIPAPEQVPMAAPPQMNFFIPQQVANPNAPVDFLTPGGAPVQIGEPQRK